MINKTSTVTYREPMVNYYVQDVEGLAAYCAHFGFSETFRTPQDGLAIHVEDPEGNPIQIVAQRKAR